MRLELSNIIHTPGSVLPFAFDLDLSELDFYGEHRLPEPVHIEGSVHNRAEMLVFQATATTNLHLHCDSCGKAFQRPATVQVEHLLVTELENEDDADDMDLIVLDGTTLDVDELMHDEVILAMDTKNLCREDCKGRCPRCGKDLNDGPCDCKPELDPRFAVLAKLLEQDE